MEESIAKEIKQEMTYKYYIKFNGLLSELAEWLIYFIIVDNH